MKKYISYIIVVLVLGAGVWFATSNQTQGTNLQTKTVTQLSGSDFIKMHNENLESVLLDVRTPAEYAAGHIEGALNIDFQNTNFSEEVGKLDKNKTYFVYCRSGNRSAQAIDLMQGLGFQSIVELKGGINAFPELIKE